MNQNNAMDCQLKSQVLVDVKFEKLPKTVQNSDKLVQVNIS